METKELSPLQQRLKIVGEAIKAGRTNAKLSQSQLGTLIGTTKHDLSRIENGKKNFTTNLLMKIIVALNMTITITDKDNNTLIKINEN